MSTHFLIHRSPWLAFATQPDHFEAFWRCLSTLRQRGFEAALYAGQNGDDPPWSLLKHGGRWQGLLLWPQEPMALQWQHMSRQLGIALCWMPAVSQAAGGF